MNKIYQKIPNNYNNSLFTIKSNLNDSLNYTCLYGNVICNLDLILVNLA